MKLTDDKRQLNSIVLTVLDAQMLVATDPKIRSENRAMHRKLLLELADDAGIPTDGLLKT